MDHVEWDGLTHHDTIFPLFLFIAGISFPFSLEKQREQGKSESDIYKRIVRRGITLVLLGCVYNGLLQFDFANLRCASVLARIGLMDVCRLAVRAFPDFSQGVDSRDDLGRLLGLIAFYPCAGCGGRTVHAGRQLGRLCGSFVVAGAFASRIFDPEGLLSTLPGIVTAMLGMFTGEFIKLRKEGLTDKRKVAGLVLAGVLLLLVGVLWSLVFPINKKLWSSSFVCVVGAYSVYDLFGAKFIDFSLYIPRPVWRTCRMDAGSRAAFGWFDQLHCRCWGFLYFLYRQRIFLKV